MVNERDKHIVELFLNAARREIDKGNCYFLGSRILNIDGEKVLAYEALQNLGIKRIKEIWNYIYNLKPNECVKVDWDYKPYKGNRDFSSEIYVFKKLINNNKVYIKLALNERGVLCISFHKSN